MKRVFSRRLLLSAGAGSLALPFLPSLSRGDTNAEAPLRLVLFYNPNGTVAEDFWPDLTASETDFSLKAILQPFEPYRQRMLLAKGIDSSVAMDPSNRGGPHQRGIGALFTGQTLLEGAFKDGCGAAAGWPNGPSIDQIIASQIGIGTAFSSVEVGVRANVHDVQGRISYSGSGSPLPPINDPVALYERLFFRDVPLDPNDADSRAKAVLDTVKDQVGLLSKRVGSEDRITLAKHLSLVEDLERRLSTANGVCLAPAAPEYMAEDSEDTMPAISRAQLDLLAHALTCDLTRVASVQYSTGFNAIRYPWLDDFGEGHTLSHSGDSSIEQWSALAGRSRWQAEEIRYFMDLLAAVPEGDGTVLDNTVIVWSSEISRGNSHSLADIPYVLLGDARGAINTGRFLNYAQVSSCDYLHAIIAAFGVEMEAFGHPDHSTGILSGILK